MENISAYANQGKREYQEDKYYFSEKVMAISDGMGGHVKGDVASGIVIDTIKQWETQFPESDKEIEKWGQSLTDSILTNLMKYRSENPESDGMGATLAAVFKSNGQYYSMHIGDSRVYHIKKDGSIQWRSKDHSVVQTLIDNGEITEEEARYHPKKSVLTNALLAKENIKITPFINRLGDIQAGDRLMVCSDGVLETWKDKAIEKLFSSGKDSAGIIKNMEYYCNQISLDNNSAVVGTV